MEKKIEAEDFVKHVKNLVNYWRKQSMTEKEKLNGLAFSILVLLDGDNLSAGSYELKKCIWDEKGENIIATTEHIGGYLHELYHN